MLGRLWTLLALRRNARLAWRLLRDPRVPLLSKLPLPVALIYVISPIDVAPDLLPILGQMDDLTVLIVAMMLFLRLCPADVVREHLEAMAGVRRPDPERPGEVIEGDYKVLD